ncbi:hypothetical protein [Nonomuraea insulae]|uniref:Phage integrase family protein n=1 Tax=Nonomuraea insulae TaxID=1616787 RepID=A0ABW1CEK7_9ACTN
MFQALASETAARAEEILSLDVEDLDLERRRVRVVSKGGALEYVHWATVTARLLPGCTRRACVPVRPALWVPKIHPCRSQARWAIMRCGS